MEWAYVFAAQSMGYWIFEICHFAKIRQFHVNAEDGSEVQNLIGHFQRYVPCVCLWG